jgi:hypothetical protein
VDLEFSGEIWFWKGPAPWHFVTVPDEQCAAIEALASFVTYGWGMVPCGVRVGGSEWTTALWPKDGLYVLPLRADVRRAERLDVGDTVDVRLTVG